MRKILAIILTVAMLLSTALLALPASATAEVSNIDLLTVKDWEKPWESNDPTVADNWVPINSVEEWMAIFNGAVLKDNKVSDKLVGHKYYLTADLDFSGESCPQRANNTAPSDFILDGNGHSITLAESGQNMVLFDKPGNITIQNLVIKGTVKPQGDNPDDHTNIFFSPFAKWEHLGWSKMYNVTSTLNIEYTRTVNAGQAVSGVVGLCRAGSELKNVKFTGKISIGNRAMVTAVGGLVARTNSDVVFENCSNEGSIEFSGKHAYNASGAKSAPSNRFFGVGGLIGLADSGGTVTLENCTNNAKIFYSGFEMYYHEVVDYEKNIQSQSSERALKSDGGATNCRGFVGGLVGQGNTGITFTNCENNGDIILGDSCSTNYVSYAGGIFGGIEANISAGISMTDTVNNGDITATYPHPMQVGGLVGYLRNNAENSFNGCVNNGDVTSYKTNTRNTDFSSIGGFIGYVYGATPYINLKVKIANSVNKGNMINAEKGTAFKELWGGFIAQACAVAEISFENCVNEGDVLMPTTRSNADFMGAAGFLGCFRTVGYSDWAGIPKASYTFKNCYNMGDVSGIISGGFIGDNAEIYVKNGVTIEDINVIFENCVNAGNIKGKNYASGIYAYAGKGGGLSISAKNCANGGTITADTYAGGLFGYLTPSTVANVENAVNYGSVGVVATGTDMEGITEGEEGSVSTSYAAIAGGISGGKDGIVSMTKGINMGTVRGTEFAPFTVGGLLEASNNKYLISATIADDFSGGEAVEDPLELVADANTFGITYVANYAAIKALISAQKVMRAQDYVEGADWDGFKKACDAANAVLSAAGFDPTTYTQAQANVLYANILKAYGTIAEKTDVSQLNDEIAAAKEVLLDGSEYTTSSIKTLQRAIENAEAVAAQGEKAKITDVEKSMKAIEKALSRMRTVPTPVDFTALEDLIDSVAEYEKNDYMLASWENFQTALKSAQMALSSTKQAQVDDAVQILETAISALVAKNEEPEQDTSSDESATEQATGEGETEETQESEAEGGCGSVIGSAAVILTAVVALGAGISFKKKED